MSGNGWGSKQSVRNCRYTKKQAGKIPEPVFMCEKVVCVHEPSLCLIFDSYIREKPSMQDERLNPMKRYCRKNKVSLDTRWVSIFRSSILKAFAFPVYHPAHPAPMSLL